MRICKFISTKKRDIHGRHFGLLRTKVTTPNNLIKEKSLECSRQIKVVIITFLQNFVNLKYLSGLKWNDCTHVVVLQIHGRPRSHQVGKSFKDFSIC